MSIDLPQKQMRGFAQRGGTMDAQGGQSNGSVSRTGANQALVMLTGYLHQAVSGLNNAKTINVVHLSAVIGTTVRRFGNHLLCIRHKGGTVT